MTVRSHPSESDVRNAIAQGDPIWLHVDSKLGDWPRLRAELVTQQEATRPGVELGENLAHAGSAAFAQHCVAKSPEPRSEWSDAEALDPCVVAIYTYAPIDLTTLADWTGPEPEGA